MTDSYTVHAHALFKARWFSDGNELPCPVPSADAGLDGSDVKMVADTGYG
jgi:hypothetical protein